ncbi:ankyrin repeat and MYND domain-containing protein 2-like [Mizuhopecten yessoensis]|uniref:Ankyrin repeat and MYND domain-containing protein 2 n=1 Tax=Mizuhopecten yessoensis TaxID=6573 RepID=A0A210QWM0_MIZYE|nr:ankyrin repeat and MYND domain-containing protein 2-like [Mizuhopecten yessoensis]OWF53137.1 Ankyrin repeat and MYND domain-containing protein 2 [Mizuhopecten yessoensis]
MAPKKGDFTELEKKIYDAVSQGKADEVKLLLKENTVKNVDFLDDTGMTPLQHAAFRGKRELCQLLLAHGADVNSTYHENGYTALMFAALSGNTETTRLMLEEGAKVDHVNSVGRTASQMAGFVGQHQCVSVINSYFSRENLKHYTVPQGLEKEPKLTADLEVALLKMINLSNLNPVKISLIIQDYTCVLEKSSNVVKVLDHLSEKYMKARETNDAMAMKTHYMAVIIKNAAKSYQEHKTLDNWIKRLVKGRDEDGFSEIQERLIRQMLREFPYGDSQLLQQLVRTLAAVKIGDSPSGLTVLTQGINGHRMTFDADDICGTCGELYAEKKCSACKMVRYCDARCQKLHWPTHKKMCSMLAEEYVRIEKFKKEEEEKEKAKKEEEEIQRKLSESKIQNGDDTAEAGDITTNGEGTTSSTESQDPSNTTKEVPETNSVPPVVESSS